MSCGTAPGALLAATVHNIFPKDFETVIDALKEFRSGNLDAWFASEEVVMAAVKKISAYADGADYNPRQDVWNVSETYLDNPHGLKNMYLDSRDFLV